MRLAFLPSVLPASIHAVWQSCGEYLKRYWDYCVLGVITLGIVVTLGYQMIPMPEYTLVLDEPVNPVRDYLGQRRLTLITSDFSGAAQPVKAPHRATPKKTPKKATSPPILNVNQANADQLDLLPGIGPVIAKRIVEYRGARGAFQSVEQVLEVKGIGPKNFEKMKPYLRI